MMEFKKAVTLEFGLDSSAFGPIKVTVTLTGDEMLKPFPLRSLEQIKHRADAWMQNEVLPCLDSCLTPTTVSSKVDNPLQRTGVVGGGGYKIACQLLLENFEEVPLNEEDDIRLTALPHALLGKNDRHARTDVRLRHIARSKQPA